MGEQELSKIIARIEKLEKVVFSNASTKKRKGKKQTISIGNVDFSLDQRAFAKRYAASRSGPKKFTILLAYLVGGKVDKNVELSNIKKRWNKMKSLLGKFNMFYPNDAKTKGWVTSKAYGSYSLTNEWKNVL